MALTTGLELVAVTLSTRVNCAVDWWLVVECCLRLSDRAAALLEPSDQALVRTGIPVMIPTNGRLASLFNSRVTGEV